MDVWTSVPSVRGEEWGVGLCDQEHRCVLQRVDSDSPRLGTDGSNILKIITLCYRYNENMRNKSSWRLAQHLMVSAYLTYPARLSIL
jgi:hypothetical protein